MKDLEPRSKASEFFGHLRPAVDARIHMALNCGAKGCGIPRTSKYRCVSSICLDVSLHNLYTYIYR